MKRPPTASQERFAEIIRQVTGVKLPDELTRKSLFLYIRDNKPAYDKITREARKCYRHSWLDTLDREQDEAMAECFDVY